MCKFRFAPLDNVYYNFIIASVTDLPLAARNYLECSMTASLTTNSNSKHSPDILALLNPYLVLQTLNVLHRELTVTKESEGTVCMNLGSFLMLSWGKLTQI